MEIHLNAASRFLFFEVITDIAFGTKISSPAWKAALSKNYDIS